MTDHGIAGEAHDLVYGARAATYGHPRFDFSAIAKVWTGLLQDKLKDGEVLDPHRVAVLMTGLKLCRLVQSPDHHDSRVDTIGYMLTMERLDEPTDEELLRMDAAAVLDDDLDDEGFTENPCDDPRLLDVQPRLLGEDGPRAYTFAYADDETLVSGSYKQKTIWAGSYPAACTVMKKWESEQNFTPLHEQEDKLLGRETAEHSQQLDADEDDVVFETLIDGALAEVVSGLVPVDQADWKEGDVLEHMNARECWVYSSENGLWYRRDIFSPTPVSLETLRANYSLLLVTTGTYGGLLILKDGVGYVS